MKSIETSPFATRQIFWSLGTIAFTVLPCEVPGCVRIAMRQEDPAAKVSAAVRTGQLIEDIRDALATDDRPGDIHWAGDDAEESSYVFDINRDIRVGVYPTPGSADCVTVLFEQNRPDGTFFRIGASLYADSLVEAAFLNANADLWEL